MEANSEIMAIPNNYKNTLDNLIDSSDIESPDWLRPINKELCNAPKCEGSLMSFSKSNCLDKDVLDMLLRLVSKTQDS